MTPPGSVAGRALLALAATCVWLAPRPAAGQEAAADSAWEAGEQERARRLYRRVLAEDPRDQTALLRLGLLEAWSGDRETGIALLDSLLAVNPDRRDAAVARARVLAWTGDYGAAADTLRGVLRHSPGYDLSAAEALADVLRWDDRDEAALEVWERAAHAHPDDRSVQMALAEAYRRVDRLGEAARIYRELADGDPRIRLELARVQAERGASGRARALLRKLRDSLPAEAHRALAELDLESGDYVGAERHWRSAIEADSTDASLRVGLARTLRWQGRNALALEVLRRARAIEPGAGTGDWRWARAMTRPRVTLRWSEARDSDENRMGGGSFGVALRPAGPTSRLELSLTAFLDDHEQVTREFSVLRNAAGGSVGLAYQTYRGWSLGGSVGRIRSEDDGGLVDGGDGFTTYGLGLASPGRRRFQVEADYRSEILTYTAVLIRNQVRQREGTIGTRVRIGGDWEAELTGSLADFDGPDGSNQRLEGEASLRYSPSGPATFELAATALGFDRNTNDGYYDPAEYYKAEGRVRWTGRTGVFRLTLEAEPGVRYSRRFGEEGDTAPTIGADAALGVRVGPRRTFTLRAGYSRSEPQFGGVVQPEAEGYEYYRLAASFSWVL